jgi:hypothetical protein
VSPKQLVRSMARNPHSEFSRRFAGRLVDYNSPLALQAAVEQACRQLARADGLRQSAEKMLADAEAQCKAARLSRGVTEAGRSEERSAYGGAAAARGAALSHPAVRVAIYSDEPILITGLKAVIAADPKLRLTACCRSLMELKARLTSDSPDVAVLDFTDEITAATLVELQRMAAQCKLILWTNAIEGDLALRALKYGIRGVLRKTLPLEAHRQCLHRVNSGDLWFERPLSDCIN